MFTFKDKIEILCNINNVSFASVANELGIARSSLAKWDNSIPVKETLEKLSVFFHVPINSLIGNDDTAVGLSTFKEDTETIAIIAEFVDLLNLLRFSRPASEVAKDMLISIKRNIDIRG